MYMLRERTDPFLTRGETVIRQGKVWHLTAKSATGRPRIKSWKHGHMCLTNNKLGWWCDFDQRLAFQIPVSEILAAKIAPRDTNFALSTERVLVVDYEDTNRPTALFSGYEGELYRWKEALNEAISRTERKSCR